jgi:D-alanyl-D-alanine carboxypeptidase
VKTGLLLAALAVTSCVAANENVAPDSLPPLMAATTTTALASPASTTTAPPVDSTTTSLSTTSTSSTSTSTTIDFGPVDYTALRAVGAELDADNAAVSISVWRRGVADFQFAGGLRTDGRAVDGDTPFVIASVSKLVTAMTIARLVEDGRIGLSNPVPWTQMGLGHDPAWDAVTVRQLLAHTSGMPVARTTWLDDPGSCRIPLADAMSRPPTVDQGTWVYSNGNYCALGLLVQYITGLTLDQAAYVLVFQPAGIDGPFLSTNGYQVPSVPYAKGLERLERLGGAGTWLASTDDIAAMLDAVTDDDRVTLEWPGIIVDQYGWGHTGSLDGAEACAWVLQDGATVVTAFISGSKPNSGGEVCDVVVPALATDLGIWAGEPARNPL